MARVEQMNKRKAAISKMVESIINNSSDDAEVALHDYLQMISKEIILGESDHEDEDDDSEMGARSKKSDDDDNDGEDDDDDDDDNKDDDEDDDEDVKEGFKQPSEGVMSKKVVPQTKRGGKCGIEKHGNSAPHLDDKIKGKAKYKRFPGKGKMKKLDGVKDNYNKKCDGRDKNLGTTD